MHSWYSQCAGNCIGRILHFLNVYSGLRMAEDATVGINNVTFDGKDVAIFTMNDIEVEGIGGWKFQSRFVPVFSFTEEYSYMAEVQEKLQRAAILESIVPEVEYDIKVLQHKLHKALAVRNIFAKLPESEEYKNAVVEIDNLNAKIAEQQERLVVAREHEFDYTMI